MTGIVETSVFQRIFTTIDTAVVMGQNAAIIGAAGVGKTTALNAYTRDGIRIARLTMNQSIARSMREILHSLCDAMDVPAWRGDSHKDLKSFTERYYVGDWLIIIDEAQMLPYDKLRDLLSFSPTDGGPLMFVFCSNEDVIKQVNTDRGALAQNARRIKYRAEINAIEDDDSDILSNSFGVEGLDAYEAMRAIGKRFHADGVVDVLNLARRLAKHETIKRQHILDALDSLTQYRSTLEPKRVRRRAG